MNRPVIPALFNQGKQIAQAAEEQKQNTMAGREPTASPLANLTIFLTEKSILI
jgi:hypothetical protein